MTITPNGHYPFDKLARNSVSYSEVKICIFDILPTFSETCLFRRLQTAINNEPNNGFS